MNTVLVAYATKRGSTREVANDVARVIRESGLEIEIYPAREVKSLDRYSAVVLGGALYMGRWHKDARRLLKRMRHGLASLPLAVFAMGPGSIEPEAIERARSQLTRALDAVPEVHPFSTAIFGGVIAKRKETVDARDWDAIQAWAEALAHELSARSSG